MKRFNTRALGATLLTCAMGISGAALAQGYPDRPVELIVTFGPGGGADLMGRTMAQLMEGPLGVSIPVSKRWRCIGQRRSDTTTH